ncbi:CMP-N-acetylneuraminate-beta-galactosamide-alpha-2,3-sialyltransferase 2 [Varanus komodoensis]|uniref:CMP-N-acetylneuraminate-beta-galactosamide- alpha-2,3-sialyltransferase 2-like isoform X1 n=1 Tax=Varanus komodoensis TaxID=61221 RepID=UPI001CF7A2D5|nr:CMP-N-acetylneuraminate-beta-galactosamide-alpha-2,3-sialyltransferase 2-like isoform X1 [Varanus komodoensis]XP_044303539.1 CMP-N-acetylneuraminate-beta-galactosamide-alpha-2,3-sialyltransferase 2-like isoform X1 [Varanus komodoensis]KAF7238910.1 CMP-N-acetylneuraminate-beta-galactosamide-alpha-2,3-sialyltransferase 2 [Varanus komodoensis]
MLSKGKLWGILVLSIVLSLWKLYMSVHTGLSHSSYSPGQWLLADTILDGKPCNYSRCHDVWDWFCEHFNASINCLLTPENSEIPPEVLQWWLRLQRSHKGKQVQEIIKHLFDILPSARLQDTVPCGTCAVVGNSGRLKGSKYGGEIDSHQFVLRMNTAQTVGFEDDVGTRTTHHFMYPESAVDLHPGIHLVLVPFKPLDLEWLASAFSSGAIQHTYKRVKQFVEGDKDKVLILNPAFLKYIWDNWTKHHGRYPSTGFIALIFAIHMCEQVSVFGFGADSNGNWHHYWEKNRYAGAFRRTGVHDDVFELGLIEKLSMEGKVLFYK